MFYRGNIARMLTRHSPLILQMKQSFWRFARSLWYTSVGRIPNAKWVGRWVEGVGLMWAQLWWREGGEGCMGLVKPLEAKKRGREAGLPTCTPGQLNESKKILHQDKPPPPHTHTQPPARQLFSRVHFRPLKIPNFSLSFLFSIFQILIRFRPYRHFFL